MSFFFENSCSQVYILPNAVVSIFAWARKLSKALHFSQESPILRFHFLQISEDDRRSISSIYNCGGTLLIFAVNGDQDVE